MSTSATRRPPTAPPRRRSGGTPALRWLGWVLIGAGAVVLLYVVYSLLFTNVGTGSAQRQLSEQWEAQVALTPQAEDRADRERPQPAADAEEPDGAPSESDTPSVDDGSGGLPAVEPGSAVAVLQFRRPGSDEAIVHADPLYVVSGVSVTDLRRGPGHYPSTAAPGADGNFAVAGHRTTYGAPFFHLDQLREGDEIVVTDRAGLRHVYRFAASRVVAPDEVDVLRPDPLDRGGGVITLTTCHPRFSARERLIVFGELVDEAA
jgi:sortase A